MIIFNNLEFVVTLYKLFKTMQFILVFLLLVNYVLNLTIYLHLLLSENISTIPNLQFLFRNLNCDLYFLFYF